MTKLDELLKLHSLKCSYNFSPTPKELEKYESLKKEIEMMEKERDDYHEAVKMANGLIDYLMENQRTKTDIENQRIVDGVKDEIKKLDVEINEDKERIRKSHPRWTDQRVLDCHTCGNYDIVFKEKLQKLLERKEE